MNANEAFRLAYAKHATEFAVVCANCGNTYGEHKGQHCVKGPRAFRTIADTDFAPQVEA